MTEQRAASATDVDSVLMRRALALAERGWGQTAPNPLVGAVVVAGEEVAGEGYHARYGEAHAEVVALHGAGERARGATMYVTLEPCAHYGKTPPCVDAVIHAGIARVEIAARDPSDVARGGVERLRDAGVRVDLGVERDAALELNAPFFNAHASLRPWITLKLALSADGAIADPSGVHRWITGPASRAEVHRLRAQHDAIAVGVGTVLADDPMLTVRDAPAPRVPPARIVFDSSLRIPLGSALVRTAREVPTFVVARAGSAPAAKAQALAAAGVEVLLAASSEAALQLLRERGLRSVFVEGGARLAGSLLADALVDRLIIFRSPLVLGRTAPKAFAYAPPGFEASISTLRVVDDRRFGEDAMTVYALHEVPCSPD
ncbi:MAG TPA: bifunctional diaminohydroxyphosphoribosylaminopyrimidine deaminase/5-amino-6-(5-phosphoribosylamino)uracil reductase RibD [Gemmatimonadaceae bacterium]|nr:bifunctional diaminohydroxyphosphoribosylaminopyrimidine deaminase/5-amino-6-(5-phosphoribosylamino)uracil reductase RibD [Gemmatimonadaceae bacterium]